MNFSDSILVLNSFGGWKPAMIVNGRGNQQKLDCFKKLGATEAYYSCALNWKNRLYIFGGWDEPRQISRLSGHTLERIGSLAFDHSFGACSVMGGEIFLCFNMLSWDDAKVCRKSTGPLEPYSEVLSSKFDHWDIQLSSSNSKFS